MAIIFCRISSGPGVPMRLISDANISININNSNRNIHSDLQLGKLLYNISKLRIVIISDKSGLTMAASQFSVFSPDKKILFHTSKAETVLGSEKLVLT